MAASVPVVGLWGFTIDDALVSARVAHHLATGHGYRFNAGGPVVDAVTPLGWAHILALFAGEGPLGALRAAQWLGVLGWLAAAAWLGQELLRTGFRSYRTGVLALLVCVPLAAHAVSGMETALVTALATFALVRGPKGALFAGLAAGFRPELAPWALCLSLGREFLEPSGSRRTRLALAAALAVGPFVIVAALRGVFFGHAYPLAVVAKPPDLVQGAWYAGWGLVHTGPPLLLLALRPQARASARTKASVAALAAHVLTLTLAGGDWMPLYRLFVPVLPSVVLAGAELAELSDSRVARGLRAAGLAVVSLLLAVQFGPSARAVGEQRRLLRDGARPLLAGAHRVATLDIGWVGAATRADIVDLAGVTDETIARLPGSHTNKHLPDGLLELRDIDAAVLLAEAPDLARFPELSLVNPVDWRLTTLAGFERFRAVGTVPLAGTQRAYVIVRRADRTP